MNNKYVLFIPQGGINDCFSNIVKVISYCKRNKRTLLLDIINSAYNINFSDYFYIKKLDCCIIYNSNEIKNIILSLENSNCLTVYPNNLDFNLIDLFDKTKKISFTYQRDKPYFVYNNISHSPAFKQFLAKSIRTKLLLSKLVPLISNVFPLNLTCCLFHS